MKQQRPSEVRFSSRVCSLISCSPADTCTPARELVPVLVAHRKFMPEAMNTHANVQAGPLAQGGRAGRAKPQARLASPSTLQTCWLRGPKACQGLCCRNNHMWALTAYPGLYGPHHLLLGPLSPLAPAVITGKAGKASI